MGKLEEFQRGWLVILSCAIGVGVGLTGLPFYTFGVFINPLEEAFGWSRSSISAGMMVLNAGTLFLSPLLGILMDRVGVKAIAVPSLIGLAIGMFALSFSGASIYLSYAAWLSVAILGSGTTPLTWTRAVAASFDKMRGLALGLTLMGTGLASMFGPSLVQMAISAGGWQAGFRAMGLFVLFVAVPLAVVGLKSGSSARAEDAASVNVAGLEFIQAVKRPTFWLIFVGIFFVILGQSSSTVHFVPLMRGRGVEAADAVQMMVALGLSVIIGRVLVGLALDRLHAPLVARVCLVLPAVALIVLILSSGGEFGLVSAILLGLAAGAEVDLLAYLVGRYFGLKSYGKIYGVMLSAFALGGGLGPVLTGMAYDAAGNYHTALYVGVGVFVLGAVLLGSLGKYPDLAKGRDEILA